MTNTYTLTGARLNGSIDLTFTDAILNTIKITVNEPLNDVQFRSLIESVSMHERDLPLLGKLGLTAAIQLTTPGKIALFCDMYMRYKKVKYIVSAADSGKIKLIKVDADMLTAYFTSENFIFKGKHSISNLVKYYNELRAEIAAGPAKPKSKHPDHFSQAYQNTLDSKACSDYWKHLTSLGLKPHRNGRGDITDWVKV